MGGETGFGDEVVGEETERWNEEGGRGRRRKGMCVLWPEVLGDWNWDWDWTGANAISGSCSQSQLPFVWLGVGVCNAPVCPQRRETPPLRYLRYLLQWYVHFTEYYY